MATARKLTPRAMKVMASKLASHIMDEKIAYSKRTVSRLRQSNRFPDDDDYEVYIGKSVAANQRTAEGALEAKSNELVSLQRISGAVRYKDPNTFYGVMKARPYYYHRPWIYRPTSVGDYKELVAATNYANATVERLYAWQSKSKIAQQANRPLVLLIRQGGEQVQPVVSGVPDASQLNAGSELFLVNTSTWAALAEALSVERWKSDGIMYQAAKLTAMKYRRVDVSFTYGNDKYGPRLGIPYATKYMRPMIRLALRGTATGRIKFSKPGRNIRRGTSPYSNSGQRKRYAQRQERRRNRRRR